MNYLLIPTHLSLKMIINNNYEVDFRRYKSINSLVRLHSKLYTSEFNESENKIIILTINSILVNIDIISGSFVIGSFFSNVSLGNNIIKNPRNLLYLTITSDTIHSITIWLRDHNRKRASLTRREFINAISSESDFKNILS